MSRRQRPTHGFILMLDALGISSYSFEECKELLKKLNRLKTRLEERKEAFDPLIPSKFILFGDTVIIYWPLDSTKVSLPNRLALINIQIHDIFEWGLENMLPFRGSIAIGDYLDDGNFILGSAMFDANNWCEVADWFGIICTPKTQIWIESAFEKMDEKEIIATGLHAEYIEYDVPLSKPIENDKTKRFLTFNWPNSIYFDDFRPKKSSLEKFLDLVYEIPFSKEGEKKISNGVKFFKESRKIHSE